MVVVNCPVCRNTISGTDNQSLSANLKAHMANVHDMRNIAPGGRSPYEESTSRNSPPQRYGGEAYTTSRTYEAGEGRYEEKRGMTGGLRREGYEAERRARGEGEDVERQGEVRRTLMGSREERNVIVNCPMCGDLIRGDNEDDLSDNLEDHIKDIHNIKPTIGARLSRT